MDYKYYFENADSEQKEIIALTAKTCALLPISAGSLSERS